jgi:hypothetical protein
MAEADMIRAVQAALDHRGIDDTIAEVGQFSPRGMTGSMFAGAMIGDEVGSAFGGVGEAVGEVAGVLGSRSATAASSGLPKQLLVGASDSMIYGFKMHSRRKEPDDLVFQVPRAGLDVKVHARVNVRILELIDERTGSKIELEGNRLPITHSHDFIKFLVGGEALTAADAQSTDDD